MTLKWVVPQWDEYTGLVFGGDYLSCRRYGVGMAVVKDVVRGYEYYFRGIG
jgi:hypothetical protein